MSARLTLLGAGTPDAARYAPAGLLVEFGRSRVGIDGGPGSEPPILVHAWLVSSMRPELRSARRRIADDVAMPEPVVEAFQWGRMRVEPLPVGSMLYGYRITAAGRTAVWAPEFADFPGWAAGAHLMFADAAGWDAPLPGHMCVRDIARIAKENDVDRVIYVGIGSRTARAIEDGERPPYGEWGVEGTTYLA